MTKTITTSTAKPMSFETLCKIWDYQQRLTARQAIRKQDRAKKILTMFEKYNKYAQLGHPLRYKNVKFVYVNGFGELTKANGIGVWNATISDFIAEVKAVYGKTFKWAEEYYNDHT